MTSRGFFISSTSRQRDCKLPNKHVERLGDARLGCRLALDDRLVDLRPAIHVVGLRGQQLLQDVRGAIGFKRPDFHLAEALSTELRLTAERGYVISEYGPIERA